MSRLSDLYKAMETLRKEGLSLNEDLERQISESAYTCKGKRVDERRIREDAIINH